MMSREIIPTLDISKFSDGTDKDSLAVAQNVKKACEEIGFLVIEGHGVAADILKKMEQKGRQFFDLPKEIKEKYREPEDVYFGYKSLNQTSLASSMLGKDAETDLREQYGSGRPDYEHLIGDYYECDAGRGYCYPVRWPEEISGFHQVWLSYYDEMRRLGEKIMRIFAVALELPVDYFDSMMDKHVSNLAVYNYPEQAVAPGEGQVRGGAHTDFGSLTIVNADWSAKGGLQVFTKEGEWMDVPAKPGMFAINIGDMMARWTNDRWVSTLHRVANPPAEDAKTSRRQSIVFFHTPNYDAVVECFPSCTDSDHPVKYPPITVGDHHLLKMGKMYESGEQRERKSEGVS